MNTDDAYGRLLAEAAPDPGHHLLRRGDPAADWRAVDVRTGADGSTFRIVGPGGVEADASVALPGRYNVANALGAVVALVRGGRPPGHRGRRGGRLPGRARPPGAGRARARISLCWWTILTSQARWKRCCARCARSPVAA